MHILYTYSIVVGIHVSGSSGVFRKPGSGQPVCQAERETEN